MGQTLDDVRGFSRGMYSNWFWHRSLQLLPALVADADLLVHDATFLEEPDRKYPIHATTEEALDVGRAANVKTLILYHLSIRYDRATALPALRAQVAASGFAGDCWLRDGGSSQI